MAADLPPPLPRPQLDRSTRWALPILAAVAAFAVLSYWLPAPAGTIAALLFLYVGGALSLLVLKDLAALRERRRAWQRVRWGVPTGVASDRDRPLPALLFDVADLKREHVARWRRWRRWFAGLLGLGAVAAPAAVVLTGAPDAAFVAAPAIALALLRDWMLGLAAARDQTAAVLATLRPYERAWLRIHVALLGLVLLGVALLLLGFIAYQLVVPVHVEWWRVLGFTLVWGPWGAYALVAGLDRMRRALWPRPEDAAPEVVELASPEARDLEL
jgi:hypothetical protein